MFKINGLYNFDNLSLNLTSKIKELNNSISNNSSSIQNQIPLNPISSLNVSNQNQAMNINMNVNQNQNMNVSMNQNLNTTNQFNSNPSNFIQNQGILANNNNTAIIKNQNNFSEPILLTPILEKPENNVKISDLSENEISNKFEVMKKKLLKLPAEFERINAELNGYSDLEYEVSKLYEEIIEECSEACELGNEMIYNILSFNDEIDKIVNISEDEYSNLMSQKVN